MMEEGVRLHQRNADAAIPMQDDLLHLAVATESALFEVGRNSTVLAYLLADALASLTSPNVIGVRKSARSA